MSLAVRMRGRSDYRIQLQHGMDKAPSETYITRPFPSGRGDFLVGYCGAIKQLTITNLLPTVKKMVSGSMGEVRALVARALTPASSCLITPISFIMSSFALRNSFRISSADALISAVTCFFTSSIDFLISFKAAAISAIVLASSVSSKIGECQNSSLHHF